MVMATAPKPKVRSSFESRRPRLNNRARRTQQRSPKIRFFYLKRKLTAPEISNKTTTARFTVYNVLKWDCPRGKCSNSHKRLSVWKVLIFKQYAFIQFIGSKSNRMWLCVGVYYSFSLLGRWWISHLILHFLWIFDLRTARERQIHT